MNMRQNTRGKGKPLRVNIYHSHLATCVASHMRHSLIEWSGFQGTIKDNLVQPPCCEQGPLSLAQVTPKPIQPNFEHFQFRCSIWQIIALSQCTMCVSGSKCY